MLTEEELRELETKYTRIARVREKGGAYEVVFRRPTRAEYKRFKSQINNPSLVADAQEQLARQCVVHPTRDAFDALLEEWPAIPEAASGAFSRLMGLSVEDDGK